MPRGLAKEPDLGLASPVGRVEAAPGDAGDGAAGGALATVASMGVPARACIGTYGARRPRNCDSTRSTVTRPLNRPIGTRRLLQSHAHAAPHHVGADKLNRPRRDIGQRAGRHHACCRARDPESVEQPLVRRRVLRVPAVAARTRKPAEEATGELRRHIAATLSELLLDRAERRQRSGHRQPPASRSLVPANGRGENRARIGRVPQRFPAGNEQTGVELSPGNRRTVDAQERGTFDGRLVSGGFRLGSLFEVEDVPRSGGRGHGGLQSKIGDVRSARPPITRISPSETNRYPRPLRATSRQLRANPGRPASLPARMSPRGVSPRSTADRPANPPESGEPR